MSSLFVRGAALQLRQAPSAGFCRTAFETNCHPQIPLFLIHRVTAETSIGCMPLAHSVFVQLSRQTR